VRRLTRYVLGRLVAPFGFALAALTGFMLLNQVARQFTKLAGKGLDWKVIAEVFILALPFIMALTLPMAVLVATLYGFSQLAAENEITAMRSSGVSVGQLLRPVLLVSLVIAVATFGFVDQVLPRSNTRLRTLFFDFAQKKPTFELHEQVVNDIPQSQYYLRASKIDQSNGQLRNVSIYDMGGQSSRRIIYADSGVMAVAGKTGSDLLLTLHAGEVHEFPSAAPADFRLVRFDENQVLLRNVYDKFQRNEGAIVRGDREQSTCEMLGVVRASERDETQAQVDRAALLDRDLRYLLELPALPPPAPVEQAPASGYCAWAGAIRSLVLPRTAEAQGAAQPKPSVRTTLPSNAPPSRLSAFSEIRSAASRVEEAEYQRDRYRVEVHKKWAIAFACLPFALVGIVVALRFPRGGMGLVIGGAMGVFAVFWVGLTAGEALADRGILSPWLAMWGPDIILSVLGLVGLLLVSREMGSTRGGDWQEVTDWLGERWRRLRRRAAS
jgi:lipopolysaccharide export system permease protein